jgi:hypothetical protein
MADSTNSRISITQLILIPSVITLAITLLRLIGELQHWPTVLFSRAPGGGFAIIGITWLAFVFGAYFALKLASAGDAPASAGRVIGFAILGLVLMFGGAFFIAPTDATNISFLGVEIVGLVLMVCGAALPFLPWPALAKVLLAYGYAARIPVLIIMYFSIKGNWDTHYSLGPPGVAFPSFWSKFIQIAVLPQMIFWVAFTIVAGSLAGGLAVVRWRESGRELAIAGYTILGFLVLGFVGFLLRPSTLIGQLPFSDVITRGANLKGADQLLVPTAQTSFNYLLAGAVLGAVIGIVTGYSLSKRKA